MWKAKQPTRTGNFHLCQPTGGATYSLQTAFAHGGPWHLRARPSSAPPIARVHGGQCGTHTRPTPTARIHRSEEWQGPRRVLHS
eukprot:2869645-Prymnesium_polylepis.1